MNASHITTRQASHEVRLWLWWVAATMLGWGIGFWIGFVLGYLALGNLMAVIGVSTGVGLLQWLVLQPILPRSAWWAPAGVVGLVLPIGISYLIWGEPPDRVWLLAAIVGGALAGTLQQRILRRTVAHSWWWVPASAAGWMLVLLGRAIIGYLGTTNPPEALAPVALLLQTFLPGLLLGAVTGGTLVGLRRWPGGQAPPPAAPTKAIAGRIRIALLVIIFLVPMLFLTPIIVTYLQTPLQYWGLAFYLVGAGQSISFSPDGALLAATVPDKGAMLIDLTLGRVRRTLPVAHQAPTGRMEDVTFSPDGTVLATADDLWEDNPASSQAPADVAVRLWDVATGAELRALPGPPGGVARLAFSPDGTLLAAAAPGGTLQLWNLAANTTVPVAIAQMPAEPTMAFSPDGSMLATVTADQTVKLWDVATGVERQTFAGEMTWVKDIAFSPDGRLLATSSLGHSVRLWDVAAGSEIRTLRGHRGEVTSLVFSPDGTLLATASDDTTVRLWDVATGATVHTLRGHPWKVRGVAFSPDGARLASTSLDGMVKLWDVTTGAEVQTIPWPEMP